MLAVLGMAGGLIAGASVRAGDVGIHGFLHPLDSVLELHG